MKKQKTQSRLLAVMAAVIVLLVALSATLTFAYFTAAKNVASSPMTFGKLTMGQDNGFTVSGDEHSVNLTKIVPGCEVTLGGKVVIDGNISAFVRTKLVVYEIDTTATPKAALEQTDTESEWVKSGDLFYKIAQTVENKATVDAVDDAGTEDDTAYAARFAQTVFNKIHDQMGNVLTGDWISYEGYQYYKSVIELNGTTPATILDFGEGQTAKKITFVQSETGNAWQGKQFVVSLSAQAIQAEHLLAGNGDAIELETPSNLNTTDGDIAALASAAAWGDATVANNSSTNVAGA